MKKNKGGKAMLYYGYVNVNMHPVTPIMAEHRAYIAIPFCK